MTWHVLKQPIIDATGLSQSMLHLLFGIGLFVTAILLFRRHANRLFISWVSVLLLQTVNEIGDVIDFWIAWGPKLRIANALDDFKMTMAAPTLAVLVLYLWSLARVRSERAPGLRR